MDGLAADDQRGTSQPGAGQAHVLAQPHRLIGVVRRRGDGFEKALGGRALRDAGRTAVGRPLRIDRVHRAAPNELRQNSQVRTFAIEHIRTLALLDERFEPRPLPAEAFPHSLGVFSGTPEPIEIEFEARIADHVGGREWHRSQQLAPRPDGSLLVRLCVCNDHALRSWILSFGPLARVVAPTSLSREILEQLQQARERYIPRLTFEMARMRSGQSDKQQELPLPQREYRAS